MLPSDKLEMLSCDYFLLTQSHQVFTKHTKNKFLSTKFNLKESLSQTK